MTTSSNTANSYTTVIVTYSQDFNKLSSLLDSLERFELDKVLVILNDGEQHFDELTQIVNGRARCIHHNTVADWSTNTDWKSQQYFKLMVSRLIETDWYILVDSDIRFSTLVNSFDEFFVESRAKYRAVFNDLVDPRHSKKYYYSLGYMQVTDNGYPVTSDQTPFVMHTQAVKQMLEDRVVNEKLFRTDLVTEFYLYYAYLLNTRKFHDIYTIDNKFYVDLHDKNPV